LVAATLLGGIVAFLALVPRPLVTASDPVDPSNVLSASFIISNTNFIPLNSVDVFLAVRELQGALVLRAERPPQGTPFSKVARIIKPEWHDHTLGMDERFTITIADLLVNQGSGLTWADMAIVVSYKPWILPWRREKMFRFITRKQTNGRLYWYSFPLDAPVPEFYRPN
jgi:hypothetical protein